MKTKSKWLLTAALAAGLGVMGSINSTQAVDPAPSSPPTTQPSAQNLTLPPGFTAKELKSQSGITSGLAKLTERAVTRGDYNKFLAELATADKERAREYKEADQAKLDARIDQFNQTWKTKYGKDFDLSDTKAVFDSQYSMIQGEVADPAVAAANWPVAPTPGEAMTASQQAGTEKNSGLSKGTDVALVGFPGANGMPDMTVSMVHQLLFWRIDIPRDRTGEQIYNDLLTQLSWLNDHPDQWPSDINDGYRMVAAHAMAAAYGVGSAPKAQ